MAGAVRGSRQRRAPLLAAALFAFSLSLAPSAVSVSAAPAQAPAQATDPTAPPSAAAVAPKDQEQRDAVRRDGAGFKHDSDARSMLIATGLAAFFAFAQAVGVIVTFWLMGRTAKHQLRAYLVVDSCIVTPLRAGEPVEASVTLMNVGQTPAFDVHYQTGVTVLEYETDKLPSKDAGKSAVGEVRRYFISKSSEIVKQSGQPVTAEDIKAIADGRKKRIYVHGSVFYRDIFGARQTTRFCLTIHGDRPPFTVEFYRAGNDAT